MFSLIYTRINGWVNNREAGDLRRHRIHYDVIVMDSNWLTTSNRKCWIFYGLGGVTNLRNFYLCSSSFVVYLCQCSEHSNCIILLLYTSTWFQLKSTDFLPRKKVKGAMGLRFFCDTHQKFEFSFMGSVLQRVCLYYGVCFMTHTVLVISAKAFALIIWFVTEKAHIHYKKWLSAFPCWMGSGWAWHCGGT